MKVCRAGKDPAGNPLGPCPLVFGFEHVYVLGL